MTKILFDRQFKRMELLFLKNLTENQIKAFHYELQPMADSDFIKACHEIVKNERWFPSVSCFLKYSSNNLQNELNKQVFTPEMAEKELNAL